MIHIFPQILLNGGEILWLLLLTGISETSDLHRRSQVWPVLHSLAQNRFSLGGLRPEVQTWCRDRRYVISLCVLNFCSKTLVWYHDGMFTGRFLVYNSDYVTSIVFLSCERTRTCCAKQRPSSASHGSEFSVLRTRSYYKNLGQKIDGSASICAVIAGRSCNILQYI